MCNWRFLEYFEHMQTPPVEQRAMTFWDHLAVLLKYRRAVMIYFTIMIVASVTYALLAQQWFTSRARMLPPPSDAMGLGGLLPSLAGGALGAMSMMSDDVNLVLSILESREIRDMVIDQYDWLNAHNLNTRIDAYERYDENITWEFDEFGLIIVSCEEETPELAAEIVNFIVDHARNRFAEITRAQARNNRAFLEKRLDQNYAELAVAEEALRDFQSESGLVALEDQLRLSVESISGVYSQLILAEVELQVAEATMPTTSSQVIMLRQQVEAVQNQLAKIEKADEEQVSSVLVNLDTAPEAGMQYMRLFREVELQSMILEFLVPQFEQSRLLELKEESNIYVLDWGQIPDKRSKPRRAFIVIGWMLVSFILLYPILLFKEWMIRLNVEDPERYEFIRSTMSLMTPAKFFEKTAKNQRSSSN
jgi:tyrosine-protein kinase Etk/Wzc